MRSVVSVSVIVQPVDHLLVDGFRLEVKVDVRGVIEQLVKVGTSVEGVGAGGWRVGIDLSCAVPVLEIKMVFR